MNVLILAATTEEIIPFLDQYHRNTNMCQADVLITGIGLTATTYHLTKQVGLKRPDLVIQAGIAGCFDKQILPGSVVTIKQDTIADQGVIESNELRTLFEMKLVPSNRLPYKNGWLVNPGKTWIKRSGLMAVKAISVNQVTASKQMIQLYRDKFDPAVESMEGAALHYVCLLENIPFLQVRSISNYTGERDKTKWNMKEAIVNLNHELISLIEQL